MGVRVCVEGEGAACANNTLQLKISLYRPYLLTCPPPSTCADAPHVPPHPPTTVPALMWPAYP